VKLWCCQEFVVGVLGIGSLEGVDQGSYKGRSRCSGVASVDYASWGVKVDFEVCGELCVCLEERLVGSGVGKAGCVWLPGLLAQVYYGSSEHGIAVTIIHTSSISPCRSVSLIHVCLLLEPGRAYQRIDQLDAIVLWRIVTSGNHNTNCLSIEFLGAEAGQESCSEDDRIEQVAVCLSLVSSRRV
jgi:hypothetical protein